MNPMKNGQVFAKKCLVRFLSANHLTIEACTWARQSNRQQKLQGMSKRLVAGRGGRALKACKPQDVSINQKAKASEKKTTTGRKGRQKSESIRNHF